MALLLHGQISRPLGSPRPYTPDQALDTESVIFFPLTRDINIEEGPRPHGLKPSKRGG